MPSGRSLLLKLPGELRNLVYDHIARTKKVVWMLAKVIKRSGPKLVTEANGTVVKGPHDIYLHSRKRIYSVNMQIRFEYFKVIEKYARSSLDLEVRISVTDFDFGILMNRFFKACNAEQREDLGLFGERVTIYFGMTKEFREDLGKLYRWLNFVKKEKKKDMPVMVFYRVVEVVDRERFRALLNQLSQLTELGNELQEIIRTFGEWYEKLDMRTGAALGFAMSDESEAEEIETSDVEMTEEDYVTEDLDEVAEGEIRDEMLDDDDVKDEDSEDLRAAYHSRTAIR